MVSRICALAAVGSASHCARGQPGTVLRQGLRRGLGSARAGSDAGSLRLCGSGSGSGSSQDLHRIHPGAAGVTCAGGEPAAAISENMTVGLLPKASPKRPSVSGPPEMAHGHEMPLACTQ
jgi:hypothetical protein